MGSGCALLIALASFSISRMGSAASLRVGRTSRAVPTGRRPDVLGCVKNALKLKAHGTGGVDGVGEASELADDRAGACGRQPSSSTMDEQTFVFGVDVGLVLTSRGVKDGGRYIVRLGDWCCRGWSHAGLCASDVARRGGRTSRDVRGCGREGKQGRGLWRATALRFASAIWVIIRV